MLVWREAFFYPLGSGPLLAANDAVRPWTILDRSDLHHSQTRCDLSRKKLLVDPALWWKSAWTPWLKHKWSLAGCAGGEDGTCLNVCRVLFTRSVTHEAPQDFFSAPQ